MPFAIPPRSSPPPAGRVIEPAEPSTAIRRQAPPPCGRTVDIGAPPDLLERAVVAHPDELVPERRIEETAGSARRIQRRLDDGQEDRADANRSAGPRR